MKVRFWGTRGSLPVSATAHDIRAKLIAALSGAAGVDLTDGASIEAYVDGLDFAVAGSFGGHSSCLQLESAGAEHVILDMGSGARPLGQAMMGRFGARAPQTYHVFMSHLHWDHIMGFPFFAPVYVPGNRIIIHGCHADLQHGFRRQQQAPSFPVDFYQLRATIEFDVLEAGRTYDIAGYRVSAQKQLHQDDSYGWRFERDGAAMVYTTDSEHKIDDLTQREQFIRFFQDADLVVFDAMYSLADAISVKADWGHSSNIMGVELCQAAHVRTLCLFHHEPASDDAQLVRVLEETRRFEEITRDGAALNVISAWDGLEVDLQERGVGAVVP